MATLFIGVVTTSTLVVGAIETAITTLIGAVSAAVPAADAANKACGGDYCESELIQAGNEIQTTANSAQTVFRGLAANENPVNGLFARAIDAGNNVSSHVAGKMNSQWISTSRDLTKTMEKWGKNGVVEIDLSKVTTEVLDLSNGIPGKKGTMISNWAKSFSEVLIKNNIPADAIIRIIEGD